MLTCTNCKRNIPPKSRHQQTGELAGFQILFCDLICKMEWVRLERDSQALPGHEKADLLPATLFQPNDAVKGVCECGWETGTKDDIDALVMLARHRQKALEQRHQMFVTNQAADPAGKEER